MADFLHGPIAAVDPGAAVLALRAEGPAAADVDEAVAALQQRGADVQLMPPVDRRAGGAGADRRLSARSAAVAGARAAQGPGPGRAARAEQGDDHALEKREKEEKKEGRGEEGE